MPYHLPALLFPLIGGYLILCKNLIFRHRYKRIGAQKLIFDSIISGIILFLITYVLRLVLFSLFPSLADFCLYAVDSLPFHTKLLGTSFTSFLISGFFTVVVNTTTKKWFISIRNRFFITSIYQVGDELEQLFLESLLEGKIIIITLKSNKTYLGFVSEMNEPQETNYFIISPIASGYRKPVNKEIVFTTPYQKVVETIMDDEEDIPIEDIKIIIKQDEVLSANFFYSELYDRFQSYKKIDL